MSPASIVLGRRKIDGNNLKATFGRYYEVSAVPTTQTRSNAPVQYASDHPIAKEDTIL